MGSDLKIELLARRVRIATAIAAGRDVEDHVETVGQLVPPRFAIGALLGRRQKERTTPQLNREQARRIANGLDRFAEALQPVAQELSDPQLSLLASEAPQWGAAVWDPRQDAAHAYGQLKVTLGILARHETCLFLAVGRED